MNFLDSAYQASSYAFAFVVMLGVLIFVHELGHFLAAKACGIRVLKFSLGFGFPLSPWTQTPPAHCPLGRGVDPASSTATTCSATR